MKGIVSMMKRYLQKITILCLLCGGVFLVNIHVVMAQVTGPQEIKWMRVGSLHQWFSNGGAEIEYGRRSRQFLTADQIDGLNWPGQHTLNKGVNVGNSLWIGTTNFTDPVTSKLYAYKVICAGRLFMYLNSEIFPDQFTMYGRFPHPAVFVDNANASDREDDDVVDVIDSNLPCDRMLVNTFHTPVGISVKRKVLAFTQQYHDNYFIYEYVFTNTGIIDETRVKKTNATLNGVVFHFQHRYSFAGESYLPVAPWAPTGVSWGLNTISDAYDVNHPGEFRAVWSYYGPHSSAPSVADDIGLPRYTDGSILAGTNFSGLVVLHADRSASDHSNDPSQPSTTRRMGSDQDAQGVNQTDDVLMTRKYGFMTGGQPTQTHAEEVGKDAATGWPTSFANNVSALRDPGGYAAAQGFGPYTLAPGDSIRIVVAEAVSGIMKDRDFVKSIAKKWFNNSGPFILPNGSTTADRNIYKNTWVFSGKDSLFQSFRNAILNYNNGNYQNIVPPPPPPSEFKVNSGGNRISLTWSGAAAEAWSTFNGYQIYRAEGRNDSTFNMIFSCNKSNSVNSFDDVTARRGFNYYYYIVSKDDGSTNTVQPGVPLVSSKFLTMTNAPAYLMRPPGKSLSEIRIVPNPYNIKAVSMQFSSTPDKIAFFGLPAFCKIKLFTETGDLIETLDHTNTSGDELYYSLTSSRQVIVSGVYIAYFEVTRDIYEEGTGKLLFKKGEKTIRKFVVIR